MTLCGISDKLYTRDGEARALRAFVSWLADGPSAGACVTFPKLGAVPPGVSDVKESARTDSGVALLRGKVDGRGKRAARR